MSMSLANKPGSDRREPVTPGKESPAVMQPDISSTRWMGLDFQAMTTEDAVAHVMKTGLRADAFSYVVTPNVDHMLRLEDNAAFREMYDEAGLILNDSRVLQTLAARDGITLPPSPGADVVAGLLDALPRSTPLCVIGCSEDQIAELKSRYGYETIHHHEPPMGLRKKPDAVIEAAKFMATHKAAFHFLCVGSPQQEMVALAAKLQGNVTGIGLCCGASIDFLTGKIDRAPNIFRQARLEWLHRLASEPRRMTRRYLIEGPRIFSLWSRYRKADKPSGHGSD